MSVRIGNEHKKGYKIEQFTDLWDPYLPETGSENGTT